MTDLTQDNVLEYLRELEFSAEVQKETQQIVTVNTLENYEFPTFLRIAQDAATLQVITFFPFSYKDETAADTARLLHLLNKEIDAPGFGMDETTRTLFYRTAIPCVGQKLPKELLKIAMNTMQLAIRSFLGAIAAVSSGQLSFEAALKKANP